MEEIKEVKEVVEVVEPVAEAVVEQTNKFASVCTQNSGLIAMGVGFGVGIGTYLLATKVIAPKTAALAERIKIKVTQKAPVKDLSDPVANK